MAAAQQPARTNLVGAVQAIDPANGQITLRTDDGQTVKITPHPTAKFLRLPPGEKLANATPIAAKDIATGDRVLARGELSADKASMAASTLVVMTKADIAKKQQADQAEWQKRGVTGLVTAVDAKAGEVTINRDQAAHYRGQRQDRRQPVRSGFREIRGRQSRHAGGPQGG
jgi:Cu/Ag efflux protein CusF